MSDIDTAAEVSLVRSATPLVGKRLPRATQQPKVALQQPAQQKGARSEPSLAQQVFAEAYDGDASEAQAKIANGSKSGLGRDPDDEIEGLVHEENEAISRAENSLHRSQQKPSLADENLLSALRENGPVGTTGAQPAQVEVDWKQDKKPSSVAERHDSAMKFIKQTMGEANSYIGMEIEKPCAKILQKDIWQVNVQFRHNLNERLMANRRAGT